jgi:hypothetical protein
MCILMRVCSQFEKSIGQSILFQWVCVCVGESIRVVLYGCMWLKRKKKEEQETPQYTLTFNHFSSYGLDLSRRVFHGSAP